MLRLITDGRHCAHVAHVLGVGGVFRALSRPCWRSDARVMRAPWASQGTPI